MWWILKPVSTRRKWRLHWDSILLTIKSLLSAYGRCVSWNRWMCRFDEDPSFFKCSKWFQKSHCRATKRNFSRRKKRSIFLIPRTEIFIIHFKRHMLKYRQTRFVPLTRNIRPDNKVNTYSYIKATGWYSRKTQKNNIVKRIQKKLVRIVVYN